MPRSVTIFCILFIISYVNVSSLKAQPVINSFSPESGVIGTTVIIKGRNFNPIASKNIVYFGSVRASVSNATSSTLSVSVPPSATYQPITVMSNGLTASSIVPFLVTFTGGDSMFSQTSFSPETFISGGSCNGEMALCDFDGDGKPDIAYINGCASGLSVSKNTTVDSLISFEAVVNIPKDNYPIGIAVGDFDGDGKKDIVTANFNGNSVSVYQNKSSVGLISFDPGKDYAAGTNTYGVAVADLNADGKPDIIATNEYDHPGSISVFINTSTKGILSFTTQQIFNVGYSPRRLIVFNANNDNKPDLAVANQGSGSVSILVNSSTKNIISFENREFAVTPGSSPESISCGDLNADGKQDLIVANNNQKGTISILKNASTKANFSFALMDLPAMNYPYATVITDLNGDGKPDIAAISHYMSNSAFVYNNKSKNGKISFALPVNYTTTTQHEDISAADLNNDNKPDILFGNYMSGALVGVLLNKQNLALPVNSYNFSNLESGILDDKLSVNIYPVPVSNILNIKGLDASVRNYLEIINTNGDVVAKQTVQNNSFYEWNLDNLRKGVYYLLVNTGIKRISIKFEKNTP